MNAYIDVEYSDPEQQKEYFKETTQLFRPFFIVKGKDEALLQNYLYKMNDILKLYDTKTGKLVTELEQQKEYFIETTQLFRPFFIVKGKDEALLQIHLYPPNPYGLVKTLKDTTEQASGVLQKISTQTDQQNKKKEDINKFVTGLTTLAAEKVSKNIANLSGLIKNATGSTQTLLQKISTHNEVGSVLNEITESVVEKQEQQDLTEQLLDTTNNQVDSVLNAIKDTIEKKEQPKYFTDEMMKKMIEELNKLQLPPLEICTILKNIKEQDPKNNIWDNPLDSKQDKNAIMTQEALELLDEKLVHCETLLTGELLDTASKQVDSVLSTIKDTIEEKEQHKQLEQQQLEQQKQLEQQQQQQQEQLRQQQQTLTEQLLTSANDHVGSVLSTIQKTVEEEKQQDLTEQLLTSANSQVGSVLSAIQKTVEEEKQKLLQQEKRKEEQIRVHLETQKLFSSAQKQAEELLKRLQLEAKHNEINKIAEYLKKYFATPDDTIKKNISDFENFLKREDGSTNKLYTPIKTLAQFIEGTESQKNGIYKDLRAEIINNAAQFRERIKKIQNEVKLEKIISDIDNATKTVNEFKSNSTKHVNNLINTNLKKEITDIDNKIDAIGVGVNDKVKTKIQDFLSALFVKFNEIAGLQMEIMMNSQPPPTKFDLEQFKKQKETSLTNLKKILNKTNYFKVGDNFANKALQTFREALENNIEDIKKRKAELVVKMNGVIDQLEKTDCKTIKDENELNRQNFMDALKGIDIDTNTRTDMQKKIRDYFDKCLERINKTRRDQDSIDRQAKNKKYREEQDERNKKENEQAALATAALIQRKKAKQNKFLKQKANREAAEQNKQLLPSTTTTTKKTTTSQNDDETTTMENFVEELKTKEDELKILETRPDLTVNGQNQKEKLIQRIEELKQKIQDHGVNFLVMDLGKFIYNIHDKLITLDTLKSIKDQSPKMYENYLQAIKYDAFTLATQEDAEKIIENAETKNYNIKLFKEIKDVGKNKNNKNKNNNNKPDDKETVAEKVKLLLKIAKPKTIPKKKTDLDPTSVTGKKQQKQAQAKKQQRQNLIQLLNSSQTTATGIVEMLNSLEQERIEKEKKAELKKQTLIEQEKLAKIAKQEEINKWKHSENIEKIQKKIQPFIDLKKKYYEDYENFKEKEQNLLFIERDANRHVDKSHTRAMTHFIQKYEDYFKQKYYNQDLSLSDDDIQKYLIMFKNNADILYNNIVNMVGEYQLPDGKTIYEQPNQTNKRDIIESILTSSMLNNENDDLEAMLKQIHSFKDGTLEALNKEAGINFFTNAKLNKLNEDEIQSFCKDKIVRINYNIKTILHYNRVSNKDGLTYFTAVLHPTSDDYNYPIDGYYNLLFFDDDGDDVKNSNLDQLLKYTYINLVYVQACKLLFYSITHYCSKINYKNGRPNTSYPTARECTDCQKKIKDTTYNLLADIRDKKDISRKNGSYVPFIQTVAKICDIYSKVIYSLNSLSL